ncbi:FKBP-type peptidyl-prolyl cis-trans isomerase [Butyrivibrio sp. DSM 10294]|uniref:NifB/NifX family molybdenum-iron cluster-binding protein n=1 Tax=Butyrivibrio sp. DSM 10294 TaxID=2972457 RepID=UPI00234F7C43|nr:NifB/NifX family molybdenum-iron cluster-binding protein [Butyrivibrio sp. DSM 10294]MDC7293006.1 FKBP-type peptidyl-prolyl cis-trans isomerase [Butyrivibrio sp. DSM 10294]
MKVAVTYDNGEVFQHFGHTEKFKVYEIQEGKVVSSEIVDSNGSGHGALAGLLANHDIKVLICGGMGDGAKAALEEYGIETFAGTEGNADEAVEKYLRGELVDSGVNCDHHGEGHSCGDHEEEGGCGHCGGSDADEEEGCGGCSSGGCGGCGGCHSEPLFEGKNVGKTCRVHYKGTFNDGEQFDSSYDRGEPLEFVCGYGFMIEGFDRAVAEMEVGQIVDVHLTADQAYGEHDPKQVITIQIAELPGAESVEVGQRVYLQDMYGRPIPVKVTDKTETEITFDANHEMAGKELNFKIELVEIAD